MAVGARNLTGEVNQRCQGRDRRVHRGAAPPPNSKCKINGETASERGCAGACADDKASGIGNGISLSHRSQDTKRLSTPAPGRQRIEMQTNPLAAQLILSCDDSRQSRRESECRRVIFFSGRSRFFFCLFPAPLFHPLYLCAARSVGMCGVTLSGPPTYLPLAPRFPLILM